MGLTTMNLEIRQDVIKEKGKVKLSEENKENREKGKQKVKIMQLVRAKRKKK